MILKGFPGLLVRGKDMVSRPLLRAIAYNIVFSFPLSITYFIA